MRYASLAVVFVNNPCEIDCKDTHIFSFGKNIFANSQKMCIFAATNKIKNQQLKQTQYERYQTI